MTVPRSFITMHVTDPFSTAMEGSSEEGIPNAKRNLLDDLNNAESTMLPPPPQKENLAVYLRLVESSPLNCLNGQYQIPCLLFPLQLHNVWMHCILTVHPPCSVSEEFLLEIATISWAGPTFISQKQPEGNQKLALTRQPKSKM